MRPEEDVLDRLVMGMGSFLLGIVLGVCVVVGLWA